MERKLLELWYREQAAPSILQLPAWVYAQLHAARRRAYARGWLRTERVGVPVVVVGNLTVGGTGKTPLTLWLAQALGAQGLRVGIVSRGYAAGGSGAPRRVDPAGDWRGVGDEPLLLARRSGCPTVVGRDRVAAARVLAAGCDVILSDDGMQHLRLARDCEIVVVDGARGFGNGRLLPAGPLRERPARLAEVDAVVVNGPARHASLAAAPRARLNLAMELVLQPAVRLDGGAPPRPLAEFRGQRVHAVAGIGNPGRFFAALAAHGIDAIAHPFPDHHALRPRELRFGDGLPVLMTEKDAVKCTASADARLWVVPVQAQLAGTDGRALLALVRARIGTAVAGG